MNGGWDDTGAGGKYGLCEHSGGCDDALLGGGVRIRHVVISGAGASVVVGGMVVSFGSVQYTCSLESKRTTPPPGIEPDGGGMQQVQTLKKDLLTWVGPWGSGART